MRPSPPSREVGGKALLCMSSGFALQSRNKGVGQRERKRIRRGRGRKGGKGRLSRGDERREIEWRK